MLTINRNIKHLAPYVAIVAMVLWSLPTMAVEQINVDLRLLIDVSGSMKKNDPQNLRAPAVRLLVGMMPENAHSGIWTFGQGVSPVVPVGQVDNIWRSRARSAAGKIHSREMFTDIEQALSKATDDWIKPDPRSRRNIILLTDGLVDVSEDQLKNEASRRRIVDQLLPRIEASGASIHTIALSPNSDRRLMEQLSAATGGWYEQVDDAETLDRLFLRLFEQSAQPDTLPLHGNRFTIDKSISDMTVLAFRYPTDESLNLIAPNGEKYSILDYPPQIQWLRETNYDLVTIEAPQQGEWRLDTPEDPDNRVTVVTNLRLDVDPIPPHFLVADAPELHARLQYESANANRPDFLDWVEFSVHDTLKSSGERTTTPLWDKGEPPDALAGDGIYSATLRDDLTPGLHELVVVAHGGSFSREYRQMVRVHAHAVEIHMEPEVRSPENTEGYRLNVQIEPALLQTESLQVRGYLESEGNAGSPLTKLDHNKWQMELPATLTGDIVELEINGFDRIGRPYTFSRRLRIGNETPEVEAKSETVEPDEKIVSAQDDQPAESKASEMNWSITGVFIFVENLLLGLLCWLGYLLWKRQNISKQDPGTKSTNSHASEQANSVPSETPDSSSSVDASDTTENQAPQPTSSDADNIDAKIEEQMSPNEDSASAEPSETEQDALQADPFTIEGFENEISAGLEAWDDQSTVSDFSEEELDGGSELEGTESLEDSTEQKDAYAGVVIEDELHERTDNPDSLPADSELKIDASDMDDVATNFSEPQQDEAPQSEAQSATEPDDTLESRNVSSDEEALIIDLSADPEMATQEGSSSEQQELEEKPNAPFVDDYEQDLIAALESSDDRQPDSGSSLHEEIGDTAASMGKMEDEKGDEIESKQESIEAGGDPNIQQEAQPDDSTKMAR